MSELVSQQPRRFFICTFVSGPTDEVQEFAVLASMVDLQVEDLFDLILSFAVDVDWRWRSLYTIGDRVWCCRFQLRDVEDGVNRLHRVQKSECDGVSAWLCEFP